MKFSSKLLVGAFLLIACVEFSASMDCPNGYVASYAYRNVPGQAAWCNTNCGWTPPYCPESHCVCEVNVNFCKYEPTDLYATVPGMADWCQSNCEHVPPYCPTSHCRCRASPVPPPPSRSRTRTPVPPPPSQSRSRTSAASSTRTGSTTRSVTPTITVSKSLSQTSAATKSISRSITPSLSTTSTSTVSVTPSLTSSTSVSASYTGPPIYCISHFTAECPDGETFPPETDLRKCQTIPCTADECCVPASATRQPTPTRSLSPSNSPKTSEYVEKCEPNPCQNGGQCVIGVESTYCVCTQEWTGLNCEEPQPQTGGLRAVYVSETKFFLNIKGWDYSSSDVTSLERTLTEFYETPVELERRNTQDADGSWTFDVTITADAPEDDYTTQKVADIEASIFSGEFIELVSESLGLTEGVSTSLLPDGTVSALVEYDPDIPDVNAGFVLTPHIVLISLGSLFYLW